MNDQDLIQRNQAAMLAALAFLLRRSAGDDEQKRATIRPLAELLCDYSLHTKAYVDGKLNKAPFPPIPPVSQAEFEEMARAASGNPWPGDLVERSFSRAGKEEEPL